MKRHMARGDATMGHGTFSEAFGDTSRVFRHSGAESYFDPRVKAPRTRRSISRDPPPPPRLYSRYANRFGRTHIHMPRSHLNGLNIRPSFQQASSEGMPKGMPGWLVVYPSLAHRPADRSLNRRCIEMVAAENARARILADVAGWKHVLPTSPELGSGYLRVTDFKYKELAENANSCRDFFQRLGFSKGCPAHHN